MSRPISAAYGLYQALKDEGYELPAECGDVEMRLPVDGLIQLAYIVNLTDGPDGTLAKFGRALVRMANHDETRDCDCGQKGVVSRYGHAAMCAYRKRLEQ